MSESKDIFFKHKISISKDKWKVHLSYEHSNANNKEIITEDNIPIIPIANDNLRAAIKIEVVENTNTCRSCILTGIDGTCVLYTKEEGENEYQSVMITNDNLILSLGFTLLSINLTSLKLNWKIQPDIAEIFEFYEIENDILVRGELGIHRVALNGNVKWTFYGKDIWVNMDGTPEVRIKNNEIHLVDFESNEYRIDFNGNTIDRQRTS